MDTVIIINLEFHRDKVALKLLANIPRLPFEIPTYLIKFLSPAGGRLLATS